MPIQLRYTNNAQAQMVLKTFETLVQECGKAVATHHSITISPYENGREHGFFLHSEFANRAVAFSEYRNSDDIVIYLGVHGEFTGGDLNGPDEACYQRKIFVKREGYTQAATIVYNWLVKNKKPA